MSLIEDKYDALLASIHSNLEQVEVAIEEGETECAQLLIDVLKVSIEQVIK